MMGISILSGGLFTTIQDAGRTGYQQFGVSVSGAADRRSFVIANHLVGNDPDEAVIEATMFGPSIEFTEANIIAITGGDLAPVIDSNPVEMYRALRVEKGSVLSLNGVKTGCRSYIAFAGGLAIEPEMGSRSTDIRAKLGGIGGRKLDKGDYIGFRAPKSEMAGIESRTVPLDDFSGGEYVLRVVMGPQDDEFTDKGIEAFLGGVYTATDKLDRMGCRLEGNVIEHIGDGNIISDGISFGAVQVPSEGQPIIMLSDRQTTGGYTKIANVITADFSKIAQIKPGNKIRFQKIGITEAEELYLASLEELDAIRRELDAIRPAPTAPTVPATADASPQSRQFAVTVDGISYQVTVQELS